MKTDLFQSCGHCWVFQICWHIECSTLTASSFRIWNSSTGILSPPLALFIVMLPKAHLTSHSKCLALDDCEWSHHICIRVWYLSFSFWLTSLCIIGFKFIQLIGTDSNVFLLWMSIIQLCMCTTTSLSIFLTIISGLLPCSTCCKYCCNKQWDTCVYFNFSFLRAYALEWNCWVIWCSYS